MTQQLPSANSSLPWLADTCTPGTALDSPEQFSSCQPREAPLLLSAANEGLTCVLKESEVSWSVLWFLCWQSWVPKRTLLGKHRSPEVRSQAAQVRYLFLCPWQWRQLRSVANLVRVPSKGRSHWCRALGCEGAVRAGISEKLPGSHRGLHFPWEFGINKVFRSAEASGPWYFCLLD